MSETIPLSVPSIMGNEWKYIKECLDTGWVSSAGSFVDRFENEIKRVTGSKHAIACINGTSALHVSLLLAGVQPGDEVLVPTLTFIAPINAVRYVGAIPVFFDCDDFYNIDEESVLRFLEKETKTEGERTINRTSGRRIAAIVPVHIFGNAVRLDNILPACLERNIPVVEDATESLGSRYILGKFAGRSTGAIGLLGCLSFNGNKIITTGGGGMILTDDDRLATRARYLTTQAKDDDVRYVHDEVGFNFRLTNVQAALGVAQLERLEEYILTKEKNFFRYEAEVSTIAGLSIAPVPHNARNNYWMYALRIDYPRYPFKREALMHRLAERGIQTRPVWMLNHRQRPYIGSQYVGGTMADRLLEITLNIPCSVGLEEAGIARVIEGLRYG